MALDDLEPCPNCNHNVMKDENNRITSTMLYCQNCSYFGPPPSKEKDGRVLWNEQSIAAQKAALNKGLINCPFCGLDVTNDPDNADPNHYVICKGCQCVGPDPNDTTNGHQIWNQRSSPLIPISVAVSSSKDKPREGGWWDES